MERRTVVLCRSRVPLMTKGLIKGDMVIYKRTKFDKQAQVIISQKFVREYMHHIGGSTSEIIADVKNNRYICISNIPL